MELKNVVGDTPEERLAALNLELPPVPAPVADYVTHTQIGNVIYTSGMLPWIDGELQFTGCMGKDLSVEQGYLAFQLSTLNGLSLLRSRRRFADNGRKGIARAEGKWRCST